jgi:hypothetical protein
MGAFGPIFSLKGNQKEIGREASTRHVIPVIEFAGVAFCPFMAFHQSADASFN